MIFKQTFPRVSTRITRRFFPAATAEINAGWCPAGSGTDCPSILCSGGISLVLSHIDVVTAAVQLSQHAALGDSECLTVSPCSLPAYKTISQKGKIQASVHSREANAASV